MPRNLKELAELIARRDDITLNEAIIVVEEAKEAMQDAFYNGSLEEVEDILADFLGLEPDYLDLFIG